jgi:hypothetical protein
VIVWCQRCDERPIEIDVYDAIQTFRSQMYRQLCLDCLRDATRRNGIGIPKVVHR